MAKAKTAAAPAADQQARIEYKRLPDIKPARRNPKLHDVPALMASIRRWGFRAPPLEDAATGRIAAGHGRKEAVELIKSETPGKVPRGIVVDPDGEWKIPVVVGMAFDSEEEAEAYLLADNRLVELGGWDDSVLGPMLAGIAKGGDDALLAVGWSADDAAALARGWDSDITAIRGHGSNTDGILARVVVFCPQSAKAKVLKAVEAAVAKFPKVRVG